MQTGGGDIESESVQSFYLQAAEGAHVKSEAGECSEKMETWFFLFILSIGTWPVLGFICTETCFFFMFVSIVA